MLGRGDGGRFDVAAGAEESSASRRRSTAGERFMIHRRGQMQST